VFLLGLVGCPVTLRSGGSLLEDKGQSQRQNFFHTFPPWLAVRAGLAIPRAIHELIWGLFFIILVLIHCAVLAIAILWLITAKVFQRFG